MHVVGQQRQAPANTPGGGLAAVLGSMGTPSQPLPDAALQALGMSQSQASRAAQQPGGVPSASSQVRNSTVIRASHIVCAILSQPMLNSSLQFTIQRMWQAVLNWESSTAHQSLCIASSRLLSIISGWFGLSLEGSVSVALHYLCFIQHEL